MDGYLDVRSTFNTIDKNNHGYLSVHINGNKIDVKFSYTVKNNIKYRREFCTKVFHYDDSETRIISEIFENILYKIDPADKTALHCDILIDIDHNCKYKCTEIKTCVPLVQIFDYVLSEISGVVW